MDHILSRKGEDAVKGLGEDKGDVRRLGTGERHHPDEGFSSSALLTFWARQVCVRGLSPHNAACLAAVLAFTH